MKKCKKWIGLLLALCLAVSTLTVSALAAEPEIETESETETFLPSRDNPRSEFWDGPSPFTDVEMGPDYFFQDAWAYDVLYAWKSGLMTGTSPTTFSPNDTCTRAMAWAVLARAAGVEISGADWVEQARAWAVENGVSDGTYPDRAVTRQELATMVYNQMGCPTRFSERLARHYDFEQDYYLESNGFDDVADWALEAVYWAYQGDIGPVSISCNIRRLALGLDVSFTSPATRFELAGAATSLHKMAWIREDYLPYGYGSSQSRTMLHWGMY